MLIVNNIDILGITETWLTADVADSYVSLGNYEIVRCDNPGNVRKHGVAVYVRNNMKYITVLCYLINVVIICLCVLFIYVITAYRSPSYSDDENTLLINFLKEFCHGDSPWRFQSAFLKIMICFLIICYRLKRGSVNYL